MKKALLLICLWCVKMTGFALATLGNSGGSVAAGTICAPATTTILAHFTITQTVANTTLNTVNFTTTGTYVAADMTDFKLYGSVTNTFATAVQVGTTIAAGLGAGAHSFTAVGTPLVTAAGGVSYYWIVADVPAAATACHTIAVSAFTNTNIAVAAGGTAGTAVVSGTQTLNKVPVISASAAPTPLCAGSNLTLTGVGVACNTYAWAGPGAYTSAVLSPAAFATTVANAGIYTLTATNVCGTSTATTASVVVNAVPTGVTATASPNPVCLPGNLTLTGTAVGATTYSWTGPAGSGYSSAVLNPPAFAASALDAGIFTLTATNAGCSASASTAAVVVGSAVTAISGGGVTICVGATTPLTDPLVGGVWSSGSPVTASVSGTGVVTGLAPGAATISYTSGVCSATAIVNVLLTPPAPVVAPHSSTICNSGSVMITATAPLTPDTVLSQNANSGLVPWTVDNTGSVGTLGGTGWRSCGDGYINEIGTYHSPDNSGFFMVNSDTSGAASTTVSSLISPSFSLAGYTAASITFQVAYLYYAPGDHQTELDISTDGGATWNKVVDYVAAAASIGSTAAFATQTYSLASYLGYANLIARFYYNSTYGWYFGVDNVNITGTPMSMTPTWSPVTYLYTDAGFTTPYVAGTPTTTVYMDPATIVVPTVTVYTATVTYVGCSATDTSNVSVQPNPSPITGTMSTCVGSTSSLSDLSAGGVWSSSDVTVATIDPVFGVATGVALGTCTITYTVGACYATGSFTVTPAGSPGIISGPSNLCAGSTGTLIDGVPGGTWSVSNGSASISATGVLTGNFVGIDTITYMIVSSCGVSLTNYTDTIGPAANPGAILGPTIICAGSFALLTDTIAGGVWSATNANGTVSGTGLFTGVTPGIDTVNYTVVSTCSNTSASLYITINPLPDTGLIGGANTVCTGSTINLTETVAGGTWSSTNANATVSGAGVVTGVTSGMDTIKYSVTNGCGTLSASWPITINPSGAGTITGPTMVCAGSSISLSDASAGGIFSSGNSNATTTAAGVVSGVFAGVDTITYTLVNICGASSTTSVITINPIPATGVISGPSVVCQGATITLSSSAAGGVWSSTDATVLTVDPASGVVTGVAGGSASVNYTVTSVFGCSGNTSYPVVVDPAPAVSAISGTTNECVGGNTTLTDATTPGIWSSSDNTLATIDPVTGMVTGVAAGVVTISYTVTDVSGCSASALAMDTVNAVPFASPIQGAMTVCAGAMTTLTDSLMFGTWSSSDNTIASADPSTGIVTGISAGSALIIYSVSNICGSVSDTAMMTVNPTPVVAAIVTPATNICAGSTALLTDATTGGTWSSSDVTVATIDPTSGIITGVAAGTTNVMYTVTNSFGCTGSATTPVTFGGVLAANVYPAGPLSLCHNAGAYMHVTTAATLTSYQWMDDGHNITGATGFSYIATDSGHYAVTISDGSCTETIGGPTVMLAPNPIIGFTAPNLLFTGSFLTYQWMRNGILIPGANSSIYLAPLNGAYEVIVSDGTGCTDTSAVYVVNDISNKVNTVLMSGGISIYPNPVTGVLHVDAGQPVSLSVLAMDGRVILDAIDASEVDVTALSSGLYMVQIYDREHNLLGTGKFSKL